MNFIKEIIINRLFKKYGYRKTKKYIDNDTLVIEYTRIGDDKLVINGGPIEKEDAQGIHQRILNMVKR